VGRAIQLLDPAETGLEAKKLEASLRQRIVGQDEAIESVIRYYQTHVIGMCSPGRPVANLLFLGPTGCGKTRLVEATAESLCGDPRAVIKVDCGEFQHSHEIAKLIGSPPGYLGHRETHPVLSQEALNRCQTDTFKLSFVLFDEIEKASDALWNLLLGILDKATLTLGDNRRVDFSRSMIFMTSNVGASEMGLLMQPRIGFAVADAGQARLEAVDEELTGKISRVGLEACRRKFTPEFMNRIDRTVVFRPLGRTELRRILSIELNTVQQRIMGATSAQPWVFSVSEAGKEYLLREGADLKYGARHLKRSLERHVVNPLSNLIATGQVRGGDLVLVDFDEQLDTLTFSKETSWPANAMVPSLSAQARVGADPFASSGAEEPARWFRARNQRR
jgi:ATP-dependent Clp protease ATP-binding subunit ClpB